MDIYDFHMVDSHKNRPENSIENNINLLLAAGAFVIGLGFLIAKHDILLFVICAVISVALVIKHMHEKNWRSIVNPAEQLTDSLQKRIEGIQANGKCTDFPARRVAELILEYDNYTRIYRLDDLTQINDNLLEMKAQAAIYAYQKKLYVWRAEKLPSRARRRVRTNAGEVAICGFCSTRSMLDFEAVAVVNLEKEKQHGSDMSCFDFNRPVWFRWKDGAATPLTQEEVRELSRGYYDLLFEELQK